MPGVLDGFALARWIRQARLDLCAILNPGMANAAEVGRDFRHERSLMAKPYEASAVLTRIQHMLRSASHTEL